MLASKSCPATHPEEPAACKGQLLLPLFTCKGIGLICSDKIQDVILNLITSLSCKYSKYPFQSLHKPWRAFPLTCQNLPSKFNKFLYPMGCKCIYI